MPAVFAGDDHGQEGHIEHCQQSYYICYIHAIKKNMDATLGKLGLSILVGRQVRKLDLICFPIYSISQNKKYNNCIHQMGRLKLMIIWEYLSKSHQCFMLL